MRSPQAKPPPVPTLQQYGFHEDIDTFRERLARVTDIHVEKFGYKPSPGLAFDAARSKVPAEQFGDLFGVPRSRKLAEAQKAAKKFMPAESGLVEKQGVLEEAVRGTVEQMPLTEAELESNLIDDYLTQVRLGKEAEYLRGEHGPDIVRLLETRPSLKAKAHKAHVEHEREEVQLAQSGFPAVATGAFLRGGLQVVGGLAAGPPVLAFEEGKAINQSRKERSFMPFLEANKKLVIGIYEGVKEDVQNPRRNWGFLALDIFGGFSILRGGVARAKSGKPHRKPAGGTIEYRKGEFTEHETGSVNLLAGDVQRLKARWVNARMAERHERGTNAPLGTKRDPNPPAGFLSVMKPRWLADQIDDVLDSKLRQHLSGETKLGRLAAARRRVERALDEAPVKQLQHVDKAAPVQQRLNAVHRKVPGLTVGEQKALQVRFSDIAGDDISKLRAWREFHEHVIENAGEVAEQLGADRSFAPVIQENHRAQLQALDLAEKVFKGKPSKRMAKAEELARELEAVATERKIQEMGLAPDVATGRIAAVGDVVRGKKSLDRDVEVPGEQVSESSIYTKFESRGKTKSQTKLEQRLVAGPRVGQFWMPPQDLNRLMPELNHAFTGDSIMLGDFRVDVTRLIAESTARTFRASAKINEWQHLLKGSMEKPTGSGFDIPIADGTAKNIPAQLKKIMNDVNEGHIDAASAEYLAKAEDKTLIEHLFPGTDPETGKLIGKGPIAGVRWVDRRMVMGLNVLPTIPDTAARKFGQLANEIPRAAILYARPAYGLNLISNAQMLLIQQPAFAINNLIRSVYPERMGGYSERTIRQLDALAGEGPNLALVNFDIKGTGFLGTKAVAQLWNKFADGWMRRAAVIYEIQRQGFKGEKGFREFFDNPEHGPKRVEAGERGQAAMIKFSNLTEFEKQNLRNIFFIYPFRSRGITWSLRTIRDHPAQAAIFAAIGDEFKDELGKEIAEHVPDQLQESVGKWFAKTGFMPINWDEDGNPTVINPASVNTFSLLHDTVNFWDSPSAILRDLGPFPKLLVLGATGRDEYGNELPGPRVIDAFAKMFEDLPQVRAYRRGGKAALQKPLPPMDKADREQMVSRRRKAMEQVVLGPGWMNGFGTLVSGGMTSREVNTDAIFARFWRDLPMEERHKIEMEFLQDALVVQAKFMKRPVSDDVGTAVQVIGRETKLRSQRQADSLIKLGPRQNIDVTIDVLEEMKLIPPKDAAKARAAAEKIELASEYDEMRAGLLNRYGNRTALTKWDDDVKQLWSFRKPVLQRKLELAGYSQKLTHSQAELFEVGRKYLAYSDELDKRKKLIDMETEPAQKSFLEADLRAWMVTQKPVKGIDFHKVGWANETPKERAEHLRSAATGEWQNLSAFDKDLLGKKAGSEEAWATYYQAIAEYVKAQPFDERTLKPDQRLGLAKEVNRLHPGFIRDWDFAKKRRFSRLRELKPVRNSQNKSDWLWLLGQAEQFARAVDAEIVTERDAKEQWKDAVPQLRQWIKANSPAFDAELSQYEKQRKTFLHGLLEKGSP